MHTRLARSFLALFLALILIPAFADEYSDTVKVFRESHQSSHFFGSSYGYAVFPTIGKGGVVVGGAHGNGRVYVKGKHVGNASMTQVTVGAQLGGQAFSEIIFFQDQRTFDQFTSGNFEFGAQASAVAITAGVSAQASTGGTGAAASATKNHAANASAYQNGMAVFTVAKGGLMYEAALGGQKFSYKPVK